MKVDGLIFNRIDSDFNSYLKKNKVTDFKKLTETQRDRIIDRFEKQVLSDTSKNLYKNFPKVKRALSHNQKNITAQIQKSLRYFYSYLHTVNQIYENYREKIDKTGRPPNNKLIIPYYGYLTRIAEQIGILLLNGYPDGSLRLWRSMYDHTIVLLLFIKEYENKELHKKFIDHFLRDKSRKTESIQKHYEVLKFPPFSEPHLDDLKRKAEELKERYGDDFLTDEYGWCNELFKARKRITLRDIEEYVGFTHLRPFYIWASGYAHPSFESMLDFFDSKSQLLRLSKINEQTMKRKSFIDPMQLTIDLLHEVNVAFLERYSSDREYDINIMILRKIFKDLVKSFDEFDND